MVLVFIFTTFIKHAAFFPLMAYQKHLRVAIEARLKISIDDCLFPKVGESSISGIVERDGQKWYVLDALHPGNYSHEEQLRSPVRAGAYPVIAEGTHVDVIVLDRNPNNADPSKASYEKNIV